MTATPHTILAVDDDRDMLRLMSLRLRGEGYRVATAGATCTMSRGSKGLGMM